MYTHRGAEDAGTWCKPTYLVLSKVSVKHE